MINIDRILQTKIPDIHPTYGGVRGRTMSSRHQSYAWPALVEASPKDTVWGIGLAESSSDTINPRKWQGENLLGFALMEVRDIVKSV